MSKPIAVLISDIHYNLKNLQLSDASMRAAIQYAELHKLTLIVAGDLHDTKSLMRGEVVNRMIETFSNTNVTIKVLVGNHDRLNESAPEHALKFLSPFVTLVDRPLAYPGICLFPYYHDPKELERDLNEYAKNGNILIMHQGVKDADKGEYVFDHSAIDVSLLSSFRCFSGHYHRHQTIGTLTYIGSPFTMSFAEANDGQKGFLVIYDDGSFKQVPLNLRKHITFDVTPENIDLVDMTAYNVGDFRVRLVGTALQVEQMQKMFKTVDHRVSLKIEKNIIETLTITTSQKKLTPTKLFEDLIDKSQNDSKQKKYLKTVLGELLK
jgi:DNA repair exonuclease SbcCD nuclease subunit